MDRFSTPFKLVTDLEFRKGKFGALVRAKAWYDYALENEEVRYGHQNNDYNGGRGGANSRNPLLPFNPCPGVSEIIGGQPSCFPGTWPEAKLSDDGFRDGNYRKIIVTWGWFAGVDEAARRDGIVLGDFRDLIHKIAQRFTDDRTYFGDDTLRTLHLFARARSEKGDDCLEA